DGDVAGGILSLGVTTTDIGAGELRGHVRAADAGVGRLLDHLIGSVEVVANCSAGIDAALSRPEAVFVSLEGDRFASDGWRVGITGTGATGAALEEALQGAESAIATLCAHRGLRHEADTRLARARADCERIKMRAAEVEREREAARESLGQVASDLRAGRVEANAVDGQLAETRQQLGDDSGREAELRAALPALEADEHQQRERNRELDAARERLDSTSATVGTQRAELEIRLAALEERRSFLTARLEDLDSRLERYSVQRAEAGDRRLQLERRLATARKLRSIVERRSAEVGAELADLRSRRQAQSDAAKAAALRLDELRRFRSQSELDLAGLREQATRAELEQGEVNLKLEAVTDALRRDHDCEPGRAVATECPPLDDTTAAGRVRELGRELRIMGPINPLALEEYDALNERLRFLQDQLDDVRGSRRELNKVIRAIDEEIVSVFSAAYADVAINFEKLFVGLFPGGTGKLTLTTPEDLLNTGIELEAKPSGKNVKKLSLLSGGERSLTALAFLFAVFRSRPSPFYVMDEVEAALDDVNLHRFLQLVREFRDEAQLIIVSHQKRTMEAADCLYGITMGPGGSSRALSEKPGVDIDLTAPEHSRQTETV
ncbi:MAG: AAA family ATPase, partial [Acidimicrobiales bacterium]